MVPLESSTVGSQENTGDGFALPEQSETIEQEIIDEHTSSSSSPELPFFGFKHTSDMPISELTHPTGFPLLERDMLLSVSICSNQGLDPMTELRSERVHGKGLHGQELRLMGNHSSAAASDKEARSRGTTPHQDARLDLRTNGNMKEIVEQQHASQSTAVTNLDKESSRNNGNSASLRETRHHSIQVRSLDKVSAQGDCVKSEEVTRDQRTRPTLAASFSSSGVKESTHDSQARSWSNEEVHPDRHSSDEPIPIKSNGDTFKSTTQAGFSPDFTILYMSLKQQSLNRAALAKLMADNARQRTFKEITSGLDTKAPSPTRSARIEATEAGSNDGLSLVSKITDSDSMSNPSSVLTDLFPASEPTGQEDNYARSLEEPISLEDGAMEIGFLDPSRMDGRSRATRKYKFTVLDPTKDVTLFKIACSINPHKLNKCLSGRRTDIINGSTGEIYVRNAAERMLVQFCGTDAINKLFPRYGTTRRVLEITASEAGKSRVARVVRFMRRCCLPRGHHTCGDLRIPHDLHTGIETIRACRVFGLDADADRIENLIVRKRMGGVTWNMSKKDVELIWNSYFGALRDTIFGDVVVWFVLRDVRRCPDASAEGIDQMLDLEQYATLKLRVRDETQAKIWKVESRDAFLQRCNLERKGRKENRQRMRLRDRERQVRTAQNDANDPETTQLPITHDLARPLQSSMSKTSFGSGISSDTNAASAAGIVPNINKPLPELPSNSERSSALNRLITQSNTSLRRAFDTISRTESNATSSNLRELGWYPNSSHQYQKPRTAPIPKKHSVWKRLGKGVWIRRRWSWW